MARLFLRTANTTGAQKIGWHVFQTFSNHPGGGSGRCLRREAPVFSADCRTRR